MKRTLTFFHFCILSVKIHQDSNAKIESLGCGTCFVVFNSKSQYIKHLRGQEHLKKTEILKNKKSASSEFFCKYCTVLCSSRKQMQFHAKSAKHSFQEKRFNNFLLRKKQKKDSQQTCINSLIDNEDKENSSTGICKKVNQFKNLFQIITFKELNGLTQISKLKKFNNYRFCMKRILN